MTLALVCAGCPSCAGDGSAAAMRARSTANRGSLLIRLRLVMAAFHPFVAMRVKGSHDQAEPNEQASPVGGAPGPHRQQGKLAHSAPLGHGCLPSVRGDACDRSATIPLARTGVKEGGAFKSSPGSRPPPSSLL